MRKAFLVLLAALMAAVPAGALVRRDVTTFRLTNTGTHGVEVNVGVTSHGTLFYGGWDEIRYSTDRGATWHPTATQPPVPIAADRVLIVDRRTDRIFVEDTTLACTILSWSDDLGATWSVNPIACGGGVTDHAKVAVGARTTLADPTGMLYPNIVYDCANGLAFTPCTASVDGGITFGPSSPAGFVDKRTNTVTPSCAFQGVPVAAPNGTLYQPKAQCTATVEWSGDNGLTWSASAISSDVSGDAPSLSITPDGHLYYLWSKSNWRPYLARSVDGGLTWKKPIAVGGGLRSVVFPVVTSGANGRVGIAFFGTTDTPSGWDGNPGDAPDSVRWYLYAAVITNAAATSPTVDLMKLTSAPVNIGCLSKLGSCSKSNVGDYIDAQTTPDGHMAIAYMRNCPAGCTNAAHSDDDQGWLAYETTGASLR